MKKLKFFGHFLTFLVFGFLAITLHPAEGVRKESLMVKGLSEPVEIIKDQWAISHIYDYRVWGRSPKYHPFHIRNWRLY